MQGRKSHYLEGLRRDPDRGGIEFPQNLSNDIPKLSAIKQRTVLPHQ
jgi:hypothetical protein